MRAYLCRVHRVPGRHDRRAWGAAALFAALAFAGPERLAHADEPREESAPPPRDQADVDPTDVPEDMGAIFVPALESRTPSAVDVVVRFEGKTLATGRPGKRIVVPPGHYQVLVGEGPASSRTQAEVDVEEGRTSTVEASFGVLRIAVVDPRGRAVDEPFSVGALDPVRTFGPYRADLKAGERATIGLYLPAGRYSIALGSDPRAEEGSSAVMIPKGEVVHLRLVVDDGKLVRTEFGEPAVAEAPSPWKLSWILAADGSLAAKSNPLGGGTSGQALVLGAFTKLKLSLDTGRHLASFELLADESALGIVATPKGSAELPLQKLTDDVRAELLYTYRLGGVIGPYGHAAGYTSLFPTKYYPGRNLEAVTYGPDGSEERRERFETGQTYRMFPELGPLVVQEGAGIGTAHEGDVVRFALRGGVAARQAFFFDGRYVEDVTGDVLTARRLADVSTFGAEATAMVGFRVRGLLDVDSRLDAFLGEDQFDSAFSGKGTYRPVFRWDSSAALRLGKYVSLVYTLGVRRDAEPIRDVQTAHALRLRFAWSVF